MSRHIKYIFVFLGLLVISLLITGCQKGSQLTIVTPAGSPAYTQLYLENDSKNYQTTKLSGPDNLPAHFNEGKFDIIIAPTNMGAKLFNKATSQNKEFKYQLAGNIVYGNIYLMAKENITFNDLNGKKIVAFGEHATPGVTLKYLLNVYNVNPSEITYLQGGINVKEEFIKNLDSTDIFLLPEPVATAITTLYKTKKNKPLFRISISELYKAKNDGTSFPQASIFVKKSLKEKTKIQILKGFESSLNKVKSNPKDAAALANTLGYNEPKQVVIEKSIPNMNLSFNSGLNAKNESEKYFEVLINNNKKLLDKLPEDKFYFISK